MPGAIIGRVHARRVLLFVATLGAASIAAGSTRADAPRLSHVTFFGDSVPTALSGDPQAFAILAQGIRLDFDAEACRTIGGVSCPDDETRPPTVLDEVEARGAQLGSTVIVVAGYNEPETSFAGDLERTLAALEAAGVTHVLWATLRVAPGYAFYAGMNDALEAAAVAHPILTVVDWNAAARAADGWFQPDGVHLYAPGAEALATLLHRELVTLGIAPPPPSIETAQLPRAHRRVAYSDVLRASGGVAPFSWTCRPGLPPGLHLRADGRLTGVPRGRAQSRRLTFTATDATGTLASRSLLLTVS